MIILVGNKADLEEKRCVSKEQAEQLANELNLMYFETSAKSNQNVDEVFNFTAKEIVNRKGENFWIEQKSIMTKEKNTISINN